MTNRIVKERNWYGVKTSANEIIRRFLAQDEGKMLKEISEHLRKEGVPYSKKGLILRLERLREEGKIEKKQLPDKSHPTYHLIVKGSDYSNFGWWMKNQVERVLMEGGVFSSLNTQQQFRLMTTLIGVYAMFVEIESWKLASTKKSYKEQFKIRSSFLSEALPLLTFSTMNEYKERYSDGFIPGMYKEEEHRNQMYHYEETLRKLFPVEYKLCKEVSDTISKLWKGLPRLRH